MVVYSFILYLMTIFFLVSLPLPSREEVMHLHIERAQLNPFAFLEDIYKDSSFVWNDPATWSSLIFNKAVYQFVFNIIMLIPFGMYLHYWFGCSLNKTIFISFGLSLFFEISQLTGLFFLYPRNYRLFDVDDLLANTLGGICGWYLLIPLQKLLPSRKKTDAASYRRGEVVSPLRRFAAVLADLALIGLTYLMCLLMIPDFYNWQLGILGGILILWFGVIPVCTGRTIGMMANSTCLGNDQNKKAGKLNILFRYLELAGFMFGIPYIMYQVLPDLDIYPVLHIVLHIVLVLVYILGWIDMCKDIFHERQPFYARWTHTKVMSAIKISKSK